MQEGDVVYYHTAIGHCLSNRYSILVQSSAPSAHVERWALSSVIKYVLHREKLYLLILIRYGVKVTRYVKDVTSHWQIQPNEEIITIYVASSAQPLSAIATYRVLPTSYNTSHTTPLNVKRRLDRYVSGQLSIILTSPDSLFRSHHLPMTEYHVVSTWRNRNADFKSRILQNAEDVRSKW